MVEEFIVKVSNKNQIHIPSSVRKKMGINVDDLLVVTYDEKENVIKMARLDDVISSTRKRTYYNL